MDSFINYAVITLTPLSPAALHLCLHASDEINKYRFVKLLPPSTVNKSTSSIYAVNKANRTLLETSKTEMKHNGCVQPPHIFLFHSYQKHVTFDFKTRIGYVQKYFSCYYCSRNYALSKAGLTDIQQSCWWYRILI